MLLMENQKKLKLFDVHFLSTLYFDVIDTCSDPLDLMVSGYSEDSEDILQLSASQVLCRVSMSSCCFFVFIFYYFWGHFYVSYKVISCFSSLAFKSYK